MFGFGIELGRIGVGEVADVAGKLNRRALHTQAQAQERNFIHARKSYRLNLALNAPVAKAARHENSPATAENFFQVNVGSLNLFRVHEINFDFG